MVALQNRHRYIAPFRRYPVQVEHVGKLPDGGAVVTVEFSGGGFGVVHFTADGGTCTIAGGRGMTAPPTLRARVVTCRQVRPGVWETDDPLCVSEGDAVNSHFCRIAAFLAPVVRKPGKFAKLAALPAWGGTIITPPTRFRPRACG